MFWYWVYDPLTGIALFIAYIAGFLAVTLLASRVAPVIASRVSNKLPLATSMSLMLVSIIIAVVFAMYVVWMILNTLGLTISILALLVFVLIMNIATWLLSPWLINVMYGARHDPDLQAVVDEVARRAGMSKPPKAMVVNGPPNAFAYGNMLTGKYVAVTREMLRMTSREELEAVIGHELGHHKHRDNTLMLILGIFPSIIYFLGIMLIRYGLYSSVARLSSRRSEAGSGGLLLVAAGIAIVVISFIIQVMVLAFSRLREYYADAHGAYVAGARNMQRALAKIHLYYEAEPRVREYIDNSKLKTLFIYALTEAAANPFYSPGWRRELRTDIDHVIEAIKNQPVNPSAEVLMSHPPIPKRLRFLDKIAYGQERIH